MTAPLKPEVLISLIVQLLNKIDEVEELGDDLKNILFWNTYCPDKEEEEEAPVKQKVEEIEEKNIISMGPENKKRIFGEKNDFLNGIEGGLPPN
jgi:hypothetical protein